MSDSSSPLASREDSFGKATPSVPDKAPEAVPQPAVEVGGRKGPDPTRYGDWEKNGRCIDF
ncbi:MAG: DUF1674 domain-containing protein [Lysobacterales bacterium]